MADPNLSAPDLTAHISTFLDSLDLAPSCKLVLAYSGGIDSEVLAYGLSCYAKLHPTFRYQLIYVHHGLSANADDWAEHCQARAAVYELPLSVERVKLELGPRVSVEAEARTQRYHAISKHLAPKDILLTAHHEDDQLETILLALKRGQGPKGLAAMGQIQPFALGDGSLGEKQHCLQVRPLLDISRSAIEAFAKAHQLLHIEDESNLDDKYDRNFLRLEIIPRLKARWPSIATTASRSAKLCAEQQALVDSEVSERLPELLTKAPFNGQTVFNLSQIENLTSDWQALLLRAFIESQGFSLPSYVQLQQILLQLLTAKDDAKVFIRIGDWVLRRFAGKVYLDAASNTNDAISYQAEVIAGKIFEGLSLGGQLTLGKQAFTLKDSGIRLRLPLANEVVSLRYQLPGQFRCQPHFRDKGRELKKLMQECAVPPWLRSQIGYVFYDDKLVMALGLWVEKNFCAADDALGISFKSSFLS
ncbi:tRNA lysidine(34) synthetase TilS [Shewanella sp. A25]|nr:tRNA lysidine(34) synthetase TilS [Shewanella shenzhenensis]